MNVPNLFDVVELTVDLPEENHASHIQAAACFRAAGREGYTVTCPILPNLTMDEDIVKVTLANVSDVLMAIIEVFKYLG